ncbi:MAG: PHP domain-containing protein [Ruthenibacterium sp.]
MKIIADLHTHTLVSNHAFNTLTEMVTQANKLDLFAMAVTDHGPALPDAPHPWYFYNLVLLPQRIEGVWVLKGVEANVTDAQGTLDFTKEELAQFGFDWVVVSAHWDVLGRSLSFDDSTQMWLNVAENSAVDMIGHSESRDYAYDYDTVTKAFAKQHKVVEMNANSCKIRPGNEKNMRALALACKRNGTVIAVNSDAHSIYDLAQCNSVLPMLAEIDFPPELIVNAGKENLIRELKAHHKKIAITMEENL